VPQPTTLTDPTTQPTAQPTAQPSSAPAGPERRERLLVIGGDAAGMSAAHQALRVARRAGRELEVVALERTAYTSYSACGIPYWIAGDVAEGEDLVARDPARHRAMGVDLRTGATATGVDLGRREVTYRDAVGEHTESYDQLLVATGARATVPEWARGADGEVYAGVGPVKNLDDGADWLDRLTDRPHQRVVIAGGSYIGVEMAEAAVRRGHQVTVLTRSRVMRNLEPELSRLIADTMRAAGVEVVEDAEVQSLATTPGSQVDGRVGEVTTVRGTTYPCDLVILALGVTPVTDFLVGQGLPMGESGGLRSDPRGALADGVWAAGDCCESRHRLTGEWVYLPLGTHANKQGRAAGENAAGGSLAFGGVVGTAITRFAAAGPNADQHYLEISRTGLSLAAAADAGIDAEGLLTEGTTTSGYLPEAEPIAVHVVAERGTRRLLGAQIAGGHGAGKRIDAVAAALWGGMSVDDLAWMDLAYAPPFATAWEVVQVAARRLAERL